MRNQKFVPFSEKLLIGFGEKVVIAPISKLGSVTNETHGIRSLTTPVIAYFINSLDGLDGQRHEGQRWANVLAANERYLSNYKPELSQFSTIFQENGALKNTLKLWLSYLYKKIFLLQVGWLANALPTPLIAKAVYEVSNSWYG